MKIKIIPLILICISCANPRSCSDLNYNSINKITETANGKLYTGRCTTYENESKRSIQQYLNGKDYGKWMFYFPNGKIETKGRFNEEGQRIGKWKYYHENGELRQISRYSKRGERLGKWVKFDSEGVKVEEINYE